MEKGCVVQFTRWQSLLGRTAPGTCPRSGEPFSHMAQVSCKTGDGRSRHACTAGNRAESGRKKARCPRSSSKELIWAKRGFPQLFPKTQETLPGRRSGNNCTRSAAMLLSPKSGLKHISSCCKPDEAQENPSTTSGTLTCLQLYWKKGVSETCPTTGKLFVVWKKPQRCDGKRTFPRTYKMAHALVGMADDSQVPALLVAGVKHPCGKIGCYQH